MLSKLMAYLEDHPGANSFAICEAFGIGRGMAERLLCQLEDMGFLAIESSGCSSGGCSSGGCSSGGCSTAAGSLNALADAARSRKAAVV